MSFQSSIDSSTETGTYVIDGDDFITNTNMKKGIPLEQVVYQTLCQIIGKKRQESGEYQIEHNNLDSLDKYYDGIRKGCDFLIRMGLTILMAIECKNLNLFDRSYGVDWVRKKVLPRFDGIDAKFKLLIISYAKMISKNAREILQLNNITIIEIGDFVPNRLTKLFWRIFKSFRLKHYYQFKHLLGLGIKTVKKVPLIQHISYSNPLNKYISPVVEDNNVDRIELNNYEHDRGIGRELIRERMRQRIVREASKGRYFC